MKKCTLFLLCLFAGLSVVSAQMKVSGTILSAEDGQPVIGASVLVKGLKVGTVTDVDGKFNLNVPPGYKTVVFSYIGFDSKEEPAKPTMKVVLQLSSKTLNELVVTALGIKRSEKSLGYAASVVRNEELTAAKSGSVVNGLAGKVAGLNVTSTGGAGSSQKVIVRGYTSFVNNQPLYVVDGMPMMNEFAGNNESDNSVDFGNQANDINPEDVESVTVLKGASATALYGSRAGNGVIMITTKRGKQNQKITVSYDGSVTASNVLRVPQTQKLFGEGWPYWDGSENGSWGPKLDGRMHEWGAWSVDDYKADAPAGFKPQTKSYSYANNSLRDFYETGFETQNNISISGGTKLSTFFLSYGNTTANGVVPTDADQYKKNSISFRGSTTYGKFSANYDFSFVKKKIKAISTGQGSDGSTLLQEIIQIPVDIYIPNLKDYNSLYNNTDNYFTWYAENPYWVVANNGNSYADDRAYGKVDLNYDLLKGLKATFRVSGDYTNSIERNWNAKVDYPSISWSAYGGKSVDAGTYSQESKRISQFETTSMLNANYKLTSDLSFVGVAGFNSNEQNISYINNFLYGLTIPNYYNLGNSASSPVVKTYDEQKRLVAAFSQIDLGFRDYAFLTLSFRNDWSSTLPKNNKSYSYYGLNGSLLISEMLKNQFDINLKNVDLLKLRLAHGKTGNDVSPYKLASLFERTSVDLGYGSIEAPLSQVVAFTKKDLLGNTSLRPEITTESEIGLEGKFFGDRLGIDVAMYNKNTKDQILGINIAPESGFKTYTLNVGEIQNKGIEAKVYGSPVKVKDFEWELGATFAKNKSLVKKLWSSAGSDVTNYQITSAYQVSYMAIVGQPLGVFQVPGVAKTADGKTIVNSSGRPVTDATNKETIGTSSPDFTMGFNTKFTYKNLSLSAVVDWRKGGYFWSNTAEMLAFDGNSTITTFNERQPFLVPNSVYNAGTTENPVYVENSTPIPWTGMYSYYNHSTNLAMYKNMVLDRSYLKLREVVLTYQLPRKWLQSTPISRVDVSLIGRNLLLFTPSTNNFVDPEATNYGNEIASEIGEFCAAPTNRNFGAAVKVIF